MPDGEVSPGGIIDALHRVLAGSGARDDTARLVVLVSTSDDPSILPVREPAFGWRDGVIVVAPNAPDASCRPAAPSLERWAQENDAIVMAPCEPLSMTTMSVDYGRDCLPRRALVSPAGRPACRVRAFVPPGTSCDAAPGWRSPAAPATPPLFSEIASWDSCDVTELEGDDAGPCLVDRQYTAPASGWCLPQPSPACAAPLPRVVGGAPPPFAVIEVTCDLAR